MSGLGDAVQTDLEATMDRQSECASDNTVYEQFRVSNSKVKKISIERDMSGVVNIYVDVQHIPKDKLIPEDRQTHPESGVEKLPDEHTTTMKDISDDFAELQRDLESLLESRFCNVNPEFNCLAVTEEYDNGSLGGYFGVSVDPHAD